MHGVTQGAEGHCLLHTAFAPLPTLDLERPATFKSAQPLRAAT